MGKITLPRIVTYMGYPKLFGSMHPQEILLLYGKNILTLPERRRLYRVAEIVYEDATPIYLKSFTDDTRYESLAEIKSKHPIDAPVLEWDNYLKVFEGLFKKNE